MAAALVFYQRHLQENLNRSRVFRDRTSQLDTLTDFELRQRYRLPRHAIISIIDRVRPYVERPTRRSKAMSPETQVLIGLKYLSKGGFLMENGDLHAVSEASVSRAFHSTIDALCEALPPINFPAVHDIPRIQQEFFKLANFPKIIGSIDGTMVAIKRPTDDEAAFVCRKGYHSLNVQAVCNADLRFTNVVSRWLGSCHDAFILNNSRIGQYLEEGGVDGWLLGDSGYPCKPWLMTPVHNPTTRPEQRFNTAHKKTRNTVERAFGVLKSRFRCLHKSTGCLQFSPAKCTKIIMAAFLLHNFCIDLKVPDPDMIENDEDIPDLAINMNALGRGAQVREHLIENVFS